MNEEIKELRERLDNNIKKLQKNENSIGKKQLEEKYAKAYTKLISQIKEDAYAYANGIIFKGIINLKKEQINNEMKKSLQKDVDDAIFTKYDIDRLDFICFLWNQKLYDVTS